MIKFLFLKIFKYIERIQTDQCIQIDPYICKLETREEEEGIHRAALVQNYHTSHSMDSGVHRALGDAGFEPLHSICVYLESLGK